MIHDFPYTDFHELNLDYLMKEIRKLEVAMADFKATNTLEYRGEWDITKSYPENSIVVDGNIGYISLKPVPAGVDISNEDYWIAVANYTAQLANLGNRVTTLESEVSDIQQDMAAFESKESRLAAGTKIYCVGNSFVWGSGGSPVPPSSDRGWAYYMAQLTGCTYDRMCQNGGDFLSTSTSGATYPNMTYRQALNAFIASKTVDELAEYDYVIFGGGYNDHAQALSNYTALVTEIRTTIQLVRTNFTNAKIVLIPLMADTFKDNANNAIESEYQAFMTAWVNAAVQEGCLTCTNTASWTYGRTALGAGDNIHLNDDGYNRVARYMTAVVNGWTGSFLGYYAISWESGVTPTYQLLTVNNGIATLQAQLEVTGTALGNTQQVIGSISTAAYIAPNYLSHYFTAYTYSSGHYDPFMMSIRSNGDIRIEYNTTNKPNDTRIYISTSWPVSR